MDPIHISKAVFPPLKFFDNPDNARQMIQIIHPEFSSLCPQTGYPDFAKVVLRYVPDYACVELKSWKLYLAAFYGVGCYHEDITKRITDTFVDAINPRWAQISIDWHARGGIKTNTCLTWTNARQYVSLSNDWPDEMKVSSKQWSNV